MDFNQNLIASSQIGNMSPDDKNISPNCLDYDDIQQGYNQNQGVTESSVTEYSSKTQKYKIIQDSIFGHIKVSQNLIEIMNTKEFQRLHQLKQNGNAYLIYPSSCHTRFTHSLGVYYLSTQLMERMRETLMQKFCQLDNCQNKLKEYDRLCEYVQAAALLHDIGHGCYSHLFEEFTKENKIKSNHEEIGKAIVKRLLKRLDWSNNSIKIIQALIDGEVGKIYKEFGEYQFLTLIVHNTISNFDTDKIEYIIRDSKQTGILAPVDWQRIFFNTDLFEYQDQYGNNYYQFSYNQNIVYELGQVFEARLILNKKLYQHAKIVSADMIILDILRHVQKQKYFDIISYVSNVLNENLEQFDYYIINDNLINMLDYQNQVQYHDPVLTNLFNRLATHNIYRTLLRWRFDQTISKQDLHNLEKQLLNELNKVSETVRVVSRSIDFGMKKENPLFYMPQSYKNNHIKINQKYINAVEKQYGIEMYKDGVKMYGQSENDKVDIFLPIALQEHHIFVFTTLTKKDNNSQTISQQIIDKANEFIRNYVENINKDQYQNLKNSEIEAFN